MNGDAGRAAIAFVLALVVLPWSASAHVGSPDVFLDAQAGPYRVFVTVRPPRAIPGIAAVEVLASEDDVRDVRIVPMPLAGPGAQFAPAPDVATPSRDDPRLYTGQLWMMTAGAWQVRVAVNGSRGLGVVAVPVPTLPQATLGMTPLFRAGLFALMVLLSAGFVSIAAALWREAGLPPGARPGRARAAAAESRASSRQASSSQSSFSATGGGPRKHRATRDMSTSRWRRRRRWRPTDGWRSRYAIPVDFPAPDGRPGRRSRSPDAPVHRVAGPRSVLAPPPRRNGTGTFEQPLPNVPQATTSCSRMWCIRPASRKPSPAGSPLRDSRRSAGGRR